MTETSNNTSEQSAEELFLDFARASLKLLEELNSEDLNAETNVRYAPHRVVFIPEGWGTISDDTWSYRRMVFNNLDKFRTLPSVTACVHAHQVEGVSQFGTDRNDLDVHAGNDAQEIWLIRTLLDPLMYAIEHYNTLTPTTDQLLESYRAFRNEWTPPTIPWETIVPLLNIKSDLVEPFRIGKTLELRPFTLAEKATVWQSAYTHMENRLSVGAFSQTAFRLTTSFTLDRETSFSEIRDDSRVAQIGRFITAMRLLKPGKVGASAFFTYRISRNPRLGFGTGFMGDFEVGTWGEQYTLNMTELPETVALYDRIDRVDEKHLAVSLRRFNQSYERERGDDQLIDLVIALESCLLAELDSKTELKNRFVLRGAALLRASRKPQETRQMLSLIYDTRSSIVHSGKSLRDPGTAERFIKMPFDPPIHPLTFPNRAAELTRAILNEYLRLLDKGMSMKTINDGLDNDLLDGLTSLT